MTRGIRHRANPDVPVPPVFPSGHKIRSIFDRYSIAGGQEIQDAAAKLEKRLKSSLGAILGTVDAVEAKEDKADKDDDGGKPLQE